MPVDAPLGTAALNTPGMEGRGWVGEARGFQPILITDN